MRIHGICLLKNEDDIVGETLSKASQWCDRIYVFDTGSSDATWDEVLKLAQTNPSIVPFRQEKLAFTDSLRAEVFGRYRQEASKGDWWCRLDADEIYIDRPKEFLGQVPPSHHVVFSASCQFRFTDADLAAWERDPAAWEAQPVEDRLRYYACDYSEARFFRHRPGLKWETGAWPLHVGIVHPRRIRLKHLQYRSPRQMEKRLATRREASEQGWKLFDGYDVTGGWRDKVTPRLALSFDDGTGNFPVDESKLPRHVEKPLHRALKYLMHGSGMWA